MGKAENASALAKQIAEVLHMNQAEGLELYKELATMDDGYAKSALDALSLLIKTFGLKPTINIPTENNTVRRDSNVVIRDLMKGMVTEDLSQYYPKGKVTADDITQIDISQCYPKNYGEYAKWLREIMKPENSTKKYVACIKADCIRNGQYSKWIGASPVDDHAWVWANDMPLFLEVVVADTPARAAQLAAARAGVTEDVIELIPV